MSKDTPTPPPISPDEFARLVREASADQLEAGLRENRDLLLDAIFEEMPRAFDSARAGDLAAVVEWRIRGGDGPPLRRQLAIANGACRLEPEPTAEPDLVLELGGVDFLRLVAGQESGPRLFVFGRLKLSGSLVLAARLPALFRVPGG